MNERENMYSNKKNMMESETVSISDFMGDNVLSPDMYQYFKGLENRRIIVNNDIDNGVIEQVLIPLIDMDNDGTGEPIEIYLSSVGGTLFDGMAICAAIDKLKTPTTIIAPTYCFSMGGLILMAGKNNPNVTKKCYPYSSALIHSGSSSFEGTSVELKDTIEFYNRYDEIVKQYILTHSNITEDEYEAKRRFEWYLTADEMLEKGLVDEII